MLRSTRHLFAMGAALATVQIAGAQAQAVPLFDDSTVQTINLTVAAGDWGLLKEYYQLNAYYHATFTWNGISMDIGVRQHGSGSRSPVKPNLDLNFAKYVKHQNFLGLNFVILKANNEDPSNLREWLSMKLFRRMGIPAPREAPAQVFVNGQLLGFYYIVEHLDEQFLQRNYGESGGYLYSFQSTNTYYDFEYRGRSPLLYADLLDLKTGQPAPDLATFAKLVEIVNQPVRPFHRDVDFIATLSRYIDPKQFLTYGAAEQVLSGTDCLIGGQQGMNNFDLYQFQGTTQYNVIPWDKDFTLSYATMDIMNGIASDPNLTPNINRLAARLVGIPEYGQVYLAALTKAANLMGPAGGWADSEITREYGVIHDAATNDPHKQCLESGVMMPCGNYDFETSVEYIHSFFTVRSDFVLSQALAAGYQRSSNVPQIVAGGVAAYGGEQAISPGGLTVVTGANLASAVASQTVTPLPRIIGGTFVAVDGVRAPLSTTSAGSIAFQTPGDLAPTGTADVVVFSNGDFSDTVEPVVRARTPAVVSVSHQDGSAVSTASPVIAGETLTVYATGLGAVNGAVAIGYAPTDNTSTTVATPQLLLGNQPMTVTYAGLVAGSVGIYQVIAVTPPQLPNGASVFTFVWPTGNK